MPLVYIILVNWNGREDTLECIRSVLEMTYPNFRILLVDNDSSDGTVDAVRAEFPNVEIVETGANLGYTGGNNVGMKHCLEAGADYVFLLNNDTIIHPEALTRLVDHAEATPSAGVIGPKQYFYSDRLRIAGCGSVIDWDGATIYHRRRGEMDEAQEIHRASEPYPVDYMDGCAVLVRRDYLDKVGLLDERFHLGGYEDAEWSRRGLAAGYQEWNVPNSYVWHKVSAKAGVGSPLTTYYMTRNQLLFFWTHSSGLARWTRCIRILGRTVRTIGAWTLKPKYRRAGFFRKRDANILAIRDFFFGRFGPMGPDVALACFGPPKSSAEGGSC
ncbi:MAG: glycosyltransferase family 2 protein [Bryobacterales bacterium]